MAVSLFQKVVRAGCSVAALSLATVGLALAAGKSSSAVSKDEDPCALLPEEMVLTKTWRSGENFFGVFDVRHRSPLAEPPPVVLAGMHTDDGQFEVAEPDIWFDFRTVDGVWRPLLGVSGTWMGPDGRLSVLNRSQVPVVAQLPPPEVAEQAAEWRAKLTSLDHKTCFVSLPFKVQQERGPVQGFVSIPQPAR